MSDVIKNCNSMSELYASMGGRLEQNVDFTIHRNEELYKEIPIKSPLFRTNFYSVLIIRQGRGRYLIVAQSYLGQDGGVYFTLPGDVKGV